MRSVQSTLFALLVASGATFAESALNLTPGVSPISHDIYELHMTVFWICVVIGVLVFGAMFYAMIFHRKSRGAQAAQFHSHPWLEITWTIVPAIILILMAVPATKVLLNMNNYDREDLTIKITGYQWKWHYEYLEDGLSFFSNLSTPAAQMHNEAPKGQFYLREVDNPIVVPIHKKIRFLITSNDVNHAWWVADLGVKRDAIAGFINEAWTVIDKPGTYRGQCAELCGINHAFMPIVVVATTEQGYKDWVAKQKGQATQGEADTTRAWTLQELMKNGEQVYGRICAACHQPGGTGLPPTFPALKGSKVALGPIAKHVETVMNGVSGTAMQAFKTQLNDVELASVITYERNAWGNNTNSFVQPIQIKAYRDGKSIADALSVEPTAGGGAPASNQAASAQPSGGTATPSPTAVSAPTAQPVTQAPVTPAPTAAPVAPTATAPTTTPTTAQPAQAPQVKTGQPEISTSQTATPGGGETTTTTITITTTTKPAPAGSSPTTQPAPAAQPSVTPAPATTPTQPAPTTGTNTVAPATMPATTAPTVATPSAQTPNAAASPVEALKEAMARGEKVYMNTCAVCHNPAGIGLPPAFPALKGSLLVKGPVAGHIDRVMNGKQGTAMQAFKEQLKDQDLADVITYERNAWGNNTGTLVTPDEIKKAREQYQQQK